MNCRSPRLSRILLLASLICSCTSTDQPPIEGEGAEKIPFAALPFSIENVRLLKGPCLKATELNEAILLAYEPDRLLAKFRVRALYITGELDTCQQANGEGYIGAFSEGKRILEEEVGNGEIRSRGSGRGYLTLRT